MVAINYLWNPINDNIVREFDDSGNTIAEYTTEPDLYGNVLSQYRGGEIMYLHFDGQGNTTELTNDIGNVTDTIRYSAFGEVTKRSGTAEIPFQYIGHKGYHRNDLTDTYSVRSRNLVPEIGRWLSREPLRILFNVLANYFAVRSLVSSPPAELPKDELGVYLYGIDSDYSYARNAPAVAADASGLSDGLPNRSDTAHMAATRAIPASASLTGLDPNEQARLAVEEAVRFVDNFHTRARKLAEALFRLTCKDAYGTCFILKTSISSIDVTIAMDPSGFSLPGLCWPLSAPLAPTIRAYAHKALQGRFPRRYSYTKCVCGTGCSFYQGVTITPPTIPAATFALSGWPCNFTATLNVGIRFSALAACCLTTSSIEPLPKPLPPAVPCEEYSTLG